MSSHHSQSVSAHWGTAACLSPCALSVSLRAAVDWLSKSYGIKSIVLSLSIHLPPKSEHFLFLCSSSSLLSFYPWQVHVASVRGMPKTSQGWGNVSLLAPQGENIKCIFSAVSVSQHAALSLPKELSQVTVGGLSNLPVSLRLFLCSCTLQKSMRYFLVTSAGGKAGTFSCVSPLKYRKGRSKVKVDFETAFPL